MKTHYTVALSMIAGAALGAAAIQGLHAQAKPPVYAVAEISVTNLDAYVKEYSPLAQAGIKNSGGKLLAVGQNVTSVEGAPVANRVAIQQWDSLEKLKAWQIQPSSRRPVRLVTSTRNSAPLPLKACLNNEASKDGRGR